MFRGLLSWQRRDLDCEDLTRPVVKHQDRVLYVRTAEQGSKRRLGEGPKTSFVQQRKGN